MTFFGVHLIPFFTSVRNYFLNRFGENPYKGLFSLLSLTGLFLLIFYYQSSSTFYYEINSTAYSYSKYIMLLSFPLIIAANMQTYMRKLLRHPMSIGLGIWATMHLLVNPDFSSIILFGSFLIYSIVSAFLSEVRGSKASVSNPKLPLDILSIGIGVFLTFITFNYHEKLTGVSLT